MIILCSTDNKVVRRWQDSLGGLHSLATCSDYSSLVAEVSQHPDAIVLIHMTFPGLDTPGISEFTHSHIATRLIACADVPNDDQGLVLLKAGVLGYCNTWISAHQLQRVVEQVASGQVWVGQSLILRLIRDLPPESAKIEHSNHDNLAGFGLTEREREVAGLVGEGNSNKAIANELGVSERTVKAHLSSVFQKTGCKDRVQLALMIKSVGHQLLSQLEA